MCQITAKRMRWPLNSVSLVTILCDDYPIQWVPKDLLWFIDCISIWSKARGLSASIDPFGQQSAFIRWASLEIKNYLFTKLQYIGSNARLFDQILIWSINRNRSPLGTTTHSDSDPQLDTQHRSKLKGFRVPKAANPIIIFQIRTSTFYTIQAQTNVWR